MQPELQTIVSEVTTIAKKHNWSTIIEMANRQQTSSNNILIAASEDSNTSELQQWLKKIVPEVTIVLESLDTLAQNPSLVLAFEKVVVVFTCGVLIKGEAAKTVQTSILTRPIGSYAIVMSDAHNIHSEDDLAMIERGSRRLFLSHLLSDVAHQQNTSQLLPKYNIYLWDNEVPQTSIQDRVLQDREMLARWLTERVSAIIDTKLNLQYVQTLLGKTEAALATLQRESERPEDKADRFQPAYKEIVSLRSTIQQLVQSRIRSVKNTVTVSLQALQDELLSNLQQEIQQQARSNRPINLEYYILRGLSRWQDEREEKLLKDTRRDMIHDINEALQHMDWVWTLVNEEIAPKVRGNSYPALLVDLLQQLKPQIEPPIDRIQNLSVANNRRRSRRQNALPPTAGAAVGASTGWLLGGPFLASTLALAGSVVGGVFSNRVQTQQNAQWLARVESQFRPIIVTNMTQCIKMATENVQRYGNDIQGVLITRLEEIEHQLAALMHKAIQGNNDTLDIAIKDMNTLQDCYKRLNSIQQ